MAPGRFSMPWVHSPSYLAFPVMAEDVTREGPMNVPRLADIIRAMQFQHLKLWYGGAQNNWPLAQ